ncbi:MAG: UDP-glucose 4-epimerase GalE [Spirochaetia bacterium]|nr:UDP-glucose 4-epimerase GalE [Spirochaetia bacterium]
MKILLTGGAGYIASHTCIELVKANHEPVIVDNFYNSQKEAIKRVEAIVGKSIAYYEADVCDKEAMRSIFEENKFDAIIHFAGYKAVGESVSKPIAYYRNNIDSTLTICELMKEYNVNKIVFSSSATVYGLAEVVPLKEGMPTGCTNPYGWTKYMIEQILSDFAAANKDISVVLLRYFNPIGAHESGMIGEDPVGIPNNLMPYICQVAVGKLQKLSIFGDDYPTPDGTGVRDYIHVVDLARGHVAACEYDHNGTEIINLGTGIGYSVLDMVKAFEKANNIKIPYQIAPRRSGDIATCYADASKAKELLNWEAKYDLTTMCRDAWNWQSKNPKGYNK